MKKASLIIIALIVAIFIAGCPYRVINDPNNCWERCKKDCGNNGEDTTEVDPPLPDTATAVFTLQAKCKKSNDVVSHTNLSVEVVRGSDIQKFACEDCSNIRISCKYIVGREKEYAVTMTASKGGASEAQGLSLKSIMNSSDYPHVIFAYDSRYCGNGVTPPKKIKQFGPHWDEPWDE